MADIKTRDAVKGTIKTIDKAAIASERMKSAYVGIKEKAEQGYYADENSATEYAADRISFAADRAKDEGVHQFNKQGQKAVKTTQENIGKAKDKITDFKQSRAVKAAEQKAAQNMSEQHGLQIRHGAASRSSAPDVSQTGELCSSFETMRFTLANNFSEMWRQMEERKQLNAAFAHDLRTPLTVLKGYNEILQSNHDPITKSTAVTMGKHIFRLERYVDSMSHLRRLEDAQPISDKSNISGYVTAIADSARILCEQSGKTLSIQNNISDIPIGIDYTFVSQVNNNLISNAIRYATSKVNITYTSNNDGFYLSVSDNGCGFSKNILSKATNPYFTEEENHSEHFGLGLYICKILCEHHGGYLKIENCSIGAKVTAFFKSLD